ncbi:unnamed protein product (macronuclear) [Paramecium tetraurelia]|uniref:Transmembrane protein n=1 Tax=Paramecium tetraurelia TaxID=5888 RepID=A0BII2_PARTE|nr:uncharacterized protein GSPATT00004721001 [Paramecium tetraurelia]CAK58349.1 unnamed protein product [Paramecium tetraurelia]|eukprot:XP_001425747.1 hypothetical protein (macronuclear) [Paramecium tetraurelia strain d4-2]
MSRSSSRIVVSILTLNSLLQIYETQPFEFNDSNLMMQHPQLTSIIPTNKVINLSIGISILFLIDWKNKIDILTSLFFGISIIMQNFNILLPKTLNIIQIYFQLLFIIQQIFFQTKQLYLYIKSLESNKNANNITKINYSNQRKLPKVSKKAQKIQLKLANKEINENQTTITQDKVCVEPAPVKNEQKEEQINQLIPEQHISEADAETENQCEISHSDFSQISSFKEDQMLQIQLKINGQNQLFCCTFETFDTITQMLSSTFTNNQIIQIKIHIILNLYDENQDCSSKLWCIKKLLALQL